MSLIESQFFATGQKWVPICESADSVDEPNNLSFGEGNVMSASVLQRPTLVLNRNWQAVNIATVARALTLVWNENARVVDPDSYQLFEWTGWATLKPDSDLFVRSARQNFRVPEVIALTHFDKLPTSTVTFSRRNIFKRDRFTCQYCGCQPTPDELTIDHVLPRSHGGTSTWENCVLACVDCNHSKADRTPEQAGLKLRREPIRPAWNPVYSYSNVRIESWRKFISESYWNSELKE